MSQLNQEVSIKVKAKVSKKKGNGFLFYLKRDWQKYLMLLIPMLMVLVFCYIPMYGIQIAFKKYNIIKGIWDSPWVGLDNFKYAFELPRFGRVLFNTFRINILALIIGFPCPIIFALLINEMKGKKIVKIIQTVSYFPHFLSTVIVGGIVYQLCAPRTGVLNQLLTVLGAQEAPFLTEPIWWLFTYILSGIWESIGWGSIIYIAAIASINPELYEAALMDGANRLQKIRYITLPSIKPTIVLMLILSMGGLINIGFDRPYIFSNPMVSEIAEVISTFVYNVGLEQGNFTLATVVGLFLSVVSFTMVLIVNGIAKAIGEEGLW